MTQTGSQEVLAAFTRVREAAENHMDELDLLGHGWDEEGVTNACVHKGHPRVSVVKFNKVQEGKAVGADYLWWWVDVASGVCFGMIVQAKRLTRSHVRGELRWTVGLDHKNGQQLADLLATSMLLRVPALYAVYMGGRVYRTDLDCTHRVVPETEMPDQVACAADGVPPDRVEPADPSAECLRCQRMAISMISAYQLTAVHSPMDNAALVFSESMSLEDLVDEQIPAGRVWDLNLSKIEDGPLKDFLVNDQEGPLEIAKKIFKAVCTHRIAANQMASAVLVEVPGQPMFPEVPDDRGHFPGAYYRHFLQGVRLSPPAYVDELLAAVDASDSQPEEIVAPRPTELQGAEIDGVVLVRM